MENLVNQVPELKLKKKVETRTIHWSDLRETKNLQCMPEDSTTKYREGDVIQMVFWVDDTGYQWTHADIKLYMQTINVVDESKTIQEKIRKIRQKQMSERKTVKLQMVGV